MKSTIKSSDGLVREIEIEVPTNTVDAAFAETYHKYRKEATIKGFRPGKAPLTVIKSKFQAAVHDDVLQELVNKSFPAAIREHKLDVASTPTFPTLDLKEGRPFIYIAKVEVMPEIDAVDCGGLTLPQMEIEVSDGEVDTVVDYLRKKHADLRPVNRPAEKDDILIVDLVKLEDVDRVLEGDRFNDNEIDLSSQYTVSEFREILPGVNAGEEREVAVQYPPDYSDERFAGKSIKYLCKLKEIKERMLPPADDVFAKKTGEVETVLELRLKIREDLKKQKELDLRKFYRDQIRRQILEKNLVPIPEAMIKNYLDALVEDFKKKKQAYDPDKVTEQYRPMAVNTLRWSMLMDRLAKAEKIEVLQSDTENWIRSFAEGYNMEYDKAREMLAGSGRIQQIRETILEDKLFDFLLAKVTYVTAEAAEQQEVKNDVTEEK
ncbi:MAG: trigger factor [Candidatus Zixiibacteriota bacterium]|nr:MAG: trigger factor [candidate division Zixibacteria bacterium]